MFYTSEDIYPAINVATKIFGKQNQFLHGEGSLPNCKISTNEFGTIWFGDLPSYSDEEIQDNINMLSDTINQRVYFISGHGNTFISTNDLREIKEPTY